METAPVVPEPLVRPPLPTASELPDIAIEPLPASLRVSNGGGRLAGRTVLVTGCENFVARAIAIACAREGADLALVHFRGESDVERTVRDIEAHGRAAIAIPGDVADEAFARAAVAKTVERFETLHVVVNAAFERRRCERLEDLEPGPLARAFAVNFFGTLNVCKAALRHLGEGGAIVNTFSSAGLRGDAEHVDAAASSGAVASLTRSLARETAGRGIRVNAVGRGPVAANGSDAPLREAELRDLGADVPLGRPGRPEELAPAYVFFASDDASYVTGQLLHVAGGA